MSEINFYQRYEVSLVLFSCPKFLVAATQFMTLQVQRKYDLLGQRRKTLLLEDDMFVIAFIILFYHINVATVYIRTIRGIPFVLSLNICLNIHKSLHPREWSQEGSQSFF